MLPLNMSRRRKVLALQKEETFQTTSETQPGSSWVKRFQSTMEIVFETSFVRKADFDPASESVHGLLSEGSQNREESEPVDHCSLE